jgi:hypothetical protein
MISISRVFRTARAELSADAPGPVPDLKPTSDSKTLLVDDRSSTSSGISEQETFLNAGLEDYYLPIDSYEGRHRFDPTFQWTQAEEKKLVRKVTALKSIRTQASIR